MTRKLRVPFIFLAFSVLAIPLSLASEEMDVEYAEVMPLAPESMLLDITQTDTGFVAVGERGHIIWSADGKTWTQAEHVPTRATLTTVVSAGGRIWAGGHDAAIVTSGDGGRNWTLQFSDPELQKAVMDIQFSNETDGLAMGSYGLAFVTGDGGLTWEEIFVDEENEFHLNGIIRFDEDRLLIAGEAGYSYRSFDNGMTWEPLELPYMGSMWGGIRLPDDCVLFYGLRGHIMESCDFGENWEELDSGIQSSLSGAAYQDGLLVFAGNSGRVLTRDDVGAFTAHNHSDGVDFASVIPLDSGGFLLVGEDGVHRFPESTGDANEH